VLKDTKKYIGDATTLGSKIFLESRVVEKHGRKDVWGC
jgi:hypothetical protein